MLNKRVLIVNYLPYLFPFISFNFILRMDTSWKKTNSWYLLPFSDHTHSHHEGADPGVQLDAEADEVCVEDAQPVLKEGQKHHYKQSYLHYSQYLQKKKRKTSEFEIILESGLYQICSVPTVHARIL